MLKKILVVVGVLVAVLAVVVATRPASFRVERSLVVEEPPRVLYDAIADFHRWEHWSPWARLDPAMKTTYQGTPGQVGSSYAWSGNDKVGEGRMTVTGVQPPLKVEIRLEFLKPWKATNQTTFDLREESGGTRVVWIMQGENDLLGKAMSLVMDMDKMVGPDFEKGLASLKAGVKDGTIPR